jgi:serine/threonine protein kinase
LCPFEQLQQLQHPHIVSVVDVQKHSNKCYIVMERCRCDLLEAIQQAPLGRLPESTAAAIFIQLLSALDFCHENRVIHGDIKPENVLLTDDCTIRLCDFFLDRRVAASAGACSGSAVYLAPEIVDNSADTIEDLTAADVWSLGVTLYVMVTGTLPWKKPTRKDDAYRSFMANPHAFLPTNLSFQLKSLLVAMLTESADARITLESIWAHSWVRTHKSATIRNLFEDWQYDEDEYGVASSPLSDEMRMASPNTPASLDTDWDDCTDPELSPAPKSHSASFDFVEGAESKTSYFAAFGVLSSPTRAQSKRPRLGSCTMPPVLTHLIA